MTKTGKSFGLQLKEQSDKNEGGKLTFIQQLIFEINLYKIKRKLFKIASTGSKKVDYVDFKTCKFDIDVFKTNHSKELAKVLLRIWLIENKIRYKELEITNYYIRVRKVSWDDE